MFNGDKARFPEYATYLNSTVRALGARCKQAVAKQGIFAESKCDPEQDLDECVLELLDAKKLTIKSAETIKKEQEDGDVDKKCNPADVHLNLVQAACNSICESPWDLILKTTSTNVTRELATHGVKDGDGVTAFRTLPALYIGQSYIQVISLFRELICLKQNGSYKTLGDYTCRHQFLMKSLVDIDEAYQLPEAFRVVLFLDGLDDEYNPTVGQMFNEDRPDPKTLKMRGVLTRVQNFHINTTSISSNPNSSSQKVLLAARKQNKCFNCGEPHKGGERSCRAPCKICGGRDHTRYGCPDRKRQKGSNHNDDGGSGTQTDRHSANDAVGVHWGLLAATPKSPGMQLQRPLQDSLKNEQKSSLSKQHKAHLDSGCSGNVVGVIAGDQVSQNSSNEIQFFDSECKVKNVRKDRGSVVLGDDSSLQHRYKGEVWGLKNVLLVEGLKHHLISASRQVDDFESHVAFGPNHAHRVPIKDFEVPKTAKVIADRVGHLYEHRTAEKGLFTDARVKNILEHAHQSCGHISIELM